MFRRFLELENGIPSHDTFGRVFAQLDTEEFYDCLQQWVESLAICLQDQGVYIDGKTLRRSFDSGAFRRVALSLIKRNTTVKASLHGKRLMAGWNPKVLEQILSGEHNSTHVIALI